MTPHERLVIALRHGVIVRRKATMRYSADVVHLSAHPGDDDRFCVAGVEAVDPGEAARRVAEIAAVRRYEEGGCVGFLTRSGLSHEWWRASIGEQVRSADGIALKGVTISIHLRPVE
jgi:hypothetical protein